ncbi:MAG: hypothetical protein ACI4S2_17850 [Lachnospiraceae bacterium]
MENVSEWNDIKSLRMIDEPIAGLMYSIPFARANNLLSEKHKNIKEDKYNKVIFEYEPIEIRRLENDTIQWRRIERDNYIPHPERFDTSVGCFISDDQGEFGGWMKTPFGSMNGNFVDVFEFDGKIYAIDSMAHMLSAHFNLYEITRGGEISHVYRHINWLDRDDKTEDFLFEGKYITEEAVYFLICGHVCYYEKPRNRFEVESRLLKLTKGKVEELISMPIGFEYVTNIIVSNGKLFIAQDKMLTEVDLENGEMIHKTFIRGKAVTNLIKNKR